MKYRGRLDEGNHQDLWVAATTPAFSVYNGADLSPEAQSEFVRSLGTPQRQALVSWLVDCEVPSGGVHGLFSCMGLLLPEIKESLEFYEAQVYLTTLSPLFDMFDLGSFPHDYDKMMDKWDSAIEDNFDIVDKVQTTYWELCETYPLRKIIESHIGRNMGLYFESV